jgi:hypothetical protein
MGRWELDGLFRGGEVMPGRSKSLWRNRDYILLLSGQTVSSIGTGVSQLAFPLGKSLDFQAFSRIDFPTSSWHNTHAHIQNVPPGEERLFLLFFRKEAQFLPFY